MGYLNFWDAETENDLEACQSELVKIWIRLLVDRAKGIKALHEQLFPGQPLEKPNGLIYQYLDGEKVPLISATERRVEFAVRAERVFPGSLRWLIHPFGLQLSGFRDGFDYIRYAMVASKRNAELLCGKAVKMHQISICSLPKLRESCDAFLSIPADNWDPLDRASAYLGIVALKYHPQISPLAIEAELYDEIEEETIGTWEPAHLREPLRKAINRLYNRQIPLGVKLPFDERASVAREVHLPGASASNTKKKKAAPLRKASPPPRDIQDLIRSAFFPHEVILYGWKNFRPDAAGGIRGQSALQSDAVRAASEDEC